MRKTIDLCRFGLLLSASMIASTVSSTAAQAQSSPAPVPLSRSPVDENGVNISTGKMQIPSAGLAIGPAGRGGLNYTGYILSVNSLWTYTANSYAIAESMAGGLILGSSGKTFSGGIATDGSGETYANGVYTMRDGTKIDITPLPLPPSPNGPGGPFYDRAYIYVGANGTVNGLATKITYPDGEIVNIHYRVDTFDVGNNPVFIRFKYIRIQSVVSNRGYQLKYSYASNAAATSATAPALFGAVTGVTAINNAVDYCNPLADSCAGLTQAWPTLGISMTTNTTTVTDPLGNATVYTSDSSGRLNGIQRPGSSSINVTISYDANGRISSLTRDGVTYTYSFSLSGTVLTGVMSGPSGTIRTTTADTGTGAVLSVKDALNKTTSYQQDSSGRITQVTYPEGNYDSITYDARGNATQKVSVAKSGSGLANIVTSAGYAASCANAFTCNKPDWVKDAKGYQTDFTYDGSNGNLLTVTAPAPAGSAPVGSGIRPKTTYSYTNQQAYYKNSAGSIVASGTPISMLTGVSQCQTNASCAGTADEVLTTMSYGPQTAGTANNLLPLSSTIKAGDSSISATNAMGYDAIGNLLTVDGPFPGNADTTTYRYDAARQQIGTVAADPDGAGGRKRAAQRVTYNTVGQVTLVELGTVDGTSDTDWTNFVSLQQAASTYDGNARKTKDVLTAGGTTYGITQYSYDALGRIECTAQRMNSAVWTSQAANCTPDTAGSFGPDRIMKNIYDAVGRVTKVQGAYGTSVQADEMTKTFTDNGLAATLTDAGNNLTTYEYDGHDRLSKTRFPVSTNGAGSSSTTDYEQLTYDLNGNVTARRLRDGNMIGMGYDNLNRLVSMGGSTVADRNFSYDLLGRLTGATFSGGGASFAATYDALGRNLTQSGTLGTVSYQYDIAGRRTRTTWDDGFYVAYDYDVTGNMTAIRENGATSGVGVLATYAYDDLGSRTSLTRGNGAVTSYGFDPVSRLSSLVQDLSGTAQDLTLGFSYNPASQITSNTRSNNAYVWNGHNNVDRNYTTNGLNQYTSAGGVSFTYDVRGNLTGSDSNSYAYDGLNLMTSASGALSATLDYDPMGRLYQTTGGGNTTRLAYDGQALIAEYNTSGSLLRRYVHGPGVDEPVVWYEGSGTSDRRFLHADERGSVIALSNGSGGVIGINSYDEYGIPASTNLGRFGYTGQTWLPEIGMYYYKARIYSPTLGRFMQTDPIGYGDGMNMYAYTGNDPVNRTDPTGLAHTGANIIVTAPKWDNGAETGMPDSLDRFLLQNRGPMLGSPYVYTNYHFNPGSNRSKPTPGKGPQNTNGCTPNNQSFLGSVASVADAVALGADAVTVGAGAVAVATGPSVVGGIAGGTVAAGARFVSGAASFVSAGAKFGNGDWIGGSASVVGILAGGAATRATESFLARQFAKQNFGASVRQGIAAAYAKDLAGSQAGKQVERGVSVICP